MKKTLVMVGVGLLLVAFVVSGVLARGYGRFGVLPAASGEVIELTEEQKAELEETYAKMVDLRKELVEKQVKLGLLTEEEGNYLIERIELAWKYRDTRQGLRPGYGLGFGLHCSGGRAGGFRYSMSGRGMRW